MIKKLVAVHRDADAHWVGDGFPVRTIFSYGQSGAQLSPFLLLDYAGPRKFSPTTARLGVGPHPHRGFETVTIVYEGDVEHRDSSGGGGTIRRGDVQWMTAASGVVHEEFHGRDFARSGGMFEMVQLWVNLPRRRKMGPPRYQGILGGTIPRVPLADGGGEVRVIAGELAGRKGPAATATPIHVWDVRLAAGRHSDFTLPGGFTTALVVLHGTLTVNGSEGVGPAEMALLDRAGSDVHVECATDAVTLLLSGEPIDEPIAGYGPFVMNTSEEIRQAVADYQSGRMGRLE